MNANDSLTKARIGVIGCGAIAELHHLPALLEHPVSRDGIALCDPNQARLQAMQQKFNSAFACQNFQELIGQVDGVLIATPPASHFPIAKFFLEQGIPVLSEKPLTESLVQAEELVEISRRTGAGLAVNQTRRFYATNQRIRQLIADGVLGTLQSITYHEGYDFDWPAATGHHFQPNAKGVWSDTGIHLLDSICYWIDGTPTLVQSLNDSAGGPESLATVQLKHQGCRIEIKVSRLGRMINGFRIVGSLGSIESESGDFDEFTVVFRTGRKQRFKCASNRLTYADFAKPMLENFFAIISKKAEPTVSGASVLGAIGLLEQAYQEAQPYSLSWNEGLSRSDGNLTVTSTAQPLKVLITGASGFVGGRLAEIMHLTGVHHPLAGVRSWPRAARVANYPMQIVLCDIMQPDQVDQAVKQCQAIVHCAYSDDLNSIVSGTQHILESAAKHQIRHVVYLSSAEVYGPERTGNVTENLELTSLGRAYGDAKLAAERLCYQFAERGVLATILRPSLIYGPFGQSWSVGVAERLQSGNWSLFDSLGDGIANLIYIDDLVQAILLALASPADGPRVYNVNGPVRPTWNNYFQLFNEKLGLPPLRQVSASKSKLKSAFMDVVRGTTSAIKARFEDRLMEIYLRGGPAGKLMKRLKGTLDTTPSSGELNDLFARRAIYLDDRIRQELKYRPQYDLKAGIESTVQWMLLHELVKHPERIQSSCQNPQNVVRSEAALT